MESKMHVVVCMFVWPLSRSAIYLGVLYDVSYSYAFSFVIACAYMSYAVMTVFFYHEIVSSVMIGKFK